MQQLSTDLLEAALARAFGMDSDDARATAEVVLEAFDGEAELSDDRLPPDLRSIFYTLESRKLMSFRREDAVRDTGEKRRVFFWRVREEEVMRAAEDVQLRGRDMDVYSDLPMEAWTRRAHAG